MSPPDLGHLADSRGSGSRALMVLGTLALPFVALGLIWLAMWKLPTFLVDSEAYRLPNGQLDTAAVQSAYNAVRVPIGVTAAAALAALAAGAGVWINARNVAVARQSLLQSRDGDDERRRQWHQEHLHSRFQDAAKQLGDVAAPVRIAGALSLARVADDWEAERQTCVDVLCAYYRMPLDKSDQSERQVRRVILSEILRRLSIESPNSWSDCFIDLSGALIEGLRHKGPLRIKSLVLDSAVVEDFSFLDQVTLEGQISLDDVVFNDGFRLLTEMGPHATIWAIGAEASPGANLHIGIWRSRESQRDESHPTFVKVNINNLTLNGAHAILSLWGHFGERFLFGSGVAVNDGAFTLVTRAGTAAQGAFQLFGLSTSGTGCVVMNRSFETGLVPPVDGGVTVQVVDDASDLLSDDHDPRQPIFI